MWPIAQHHLEISRQREAGAAGAAAGQSEQARRLQGDARELVGARGGSGAQAWAQPQAALPRHAAQGYRYRGSYNRVAAFARIWRRRRQEATRSAGKDAYVRLQSTPWEAFQFDWSEDWAVIGGERTKIPPQMPHKLTLVAAADGPVNAVTGRPARCSRTAENDPYVELRIRVVMHRA
jgi:hypothetical protein